MRLFFALELDTHTKAAIASLQQELEQYCPDLVLTKEENLHITLCFLGEIEQHALTLLKEILFSLTFAPLTLTVNHLGMFPRRGGTVQWLGIEENWHLQTLQHELSYMLRKNNFLLASEPFHPHITLGRGPKGKKLPAIEPLQVNIDTLSLIHSQQKHNSITYTPIFTLHPNHLPLT